MANVTNTLYPPLPVYTFMPPFVYDKSKVKDEEGEVTTEWRFVDAGVDFSISPYNSANDIAKIHISIVDADTNVSRLSNGASAVIVNFTDDKYVKFDASSDVYKVLLDKEWFDSDFKVDKYYKIQLRFDKNVENFAVDASASEVNSYLIKNRASFSEWSSIVFVRGINMPEVILSGFEEGEDGSLPTFNKGLIPISGYIDFGDEVKQEHLQSYVVSLLDSSGKVLVTSPTVYTGNTNSVDSINYRFDIQGMDAVTDNNLTLQLDYVTNNQYAGSAQYKFALLNYSENTSFIPTITTKLYQDDGLVRIHITNDLPVSGTVHVKRACSRDNYKTWENFYSIDVSGDLDIDIIDNTVASMTWYQYSVQLQTGQLSFTKVYRSEKIFNDFFDANLSRDDKQIALRYNFNISSVKPVVNRVKVDTLGSRYPRFLENAHLNYKQMSISGMIASSMDELKLFMNKEAHFGKNFTAYELYNERNDVKEQYDYLWEREFRDALTEWLNDGEPKLFRSMTEGNIVVMLTDVNLTPNRTLSRMLYDFSATAYEVADGYSIETLESLGVFTTGVESTQYSSSNGGGSGTSGGSSSSSGSRTDYSLTKNIGQIYSKYSNSINVSEVDTVGFMYSVKSDILYRLNLKHGGLLADTKVDESSLKLIDVKIQFESLPNLYNSELKQIAQKEASQADTLVGYVFCVNDTSNKFFVGPKGYMQIPSEVDITDLYVYGKGVKFTLDYTVEYRVINNQAVIPERTSVERQAVGQLYGPFTSDTYLKNEVSKKYAYEETKERNGISYRTATAAFTSFSGVVFDVTPYTVAKVLFDENGTYNDVYIGETGVLDIHNIPCYDATIAGVLFQEVDYDRRDYLDSNECVRAESAFNTVLDIQTPVEKCVYEVGSTFKIYYGEKWYRANKVKNRWLCEIPVEGSIEYIGTVVKNTYE